MDTRFDDEIIDIENPDEVISTNSKVSPAATDNPVMFEFLDVVVIINDSYTLYIDGDLVGAFNGYDETVSYLNDSGYYSDGQDTEMAWLQLTPEQAELVNFKSQKTIREWFSDWGDND